MLLSSPSKCVSVSFHDIGRTINPVLRGALTCQGVVKGLWIDINWGSGEVSRPELKLSSFYLRSRAIDVWGRGDTVALSVTRCDGLQCRTGLILGTDRRCGHLQRHQLEEKSLMTLTLPLTLNAPQSGVKDLIYKPILALLPSLSFICMLLKFVKWLCFFGFTLAERQVCFCCIVGFGGRHFFDWTEIIMIKDSNQTVYMEAK